MQSDKSDKDIEWPALGDVCKNATDGRHPKNGRAKSKDINSTSEYDSSKENIKESVNVGARKKKNSKVLWQPLQIETPPYRKKGAGRYINGSTRTGENEKSNRGRYEYSNGSENGRGNSRNAGYKNKRGRPTNYQSHHKEQNSGSCYFIINGVTFFPQNFSDATRKNFIKRQMEYYFSDSNLVGDVYLRLKMNSVGFVALNIFLNFPRIMELTRDINTLADAVEESNKLELSYRNYQLYVRRVVDPIGWRIKNPLSNDIEIPFDESYSSISLNETTINIELPSDADTSIEISSEASECAVSVDETKTNTMSQKDNLRGTTLSKDLTLIEKTSSIKPESLNEDSQNIESLVQQVENVNLEGTSSYALSALHMGSAADQYVASFNEELSSTVSPTTASPSECDIELSDVYIDSKTISNGCDYYPHPSKSLEQDSQCRFFGAVYNDVIFYDSNELSNQGPVYYMVNSSEVLSNNSDNCNEVLHLSPEPSR